MNTISLSAATARARMGLVPFVALLAILLLTALHQLQETSKELPEGSTLHVVDPPASLPFVGDGVFLRPAVALYYPGVTVNSLRQDQLSEVADSFGDQDFVFTYEGPADD